MAPFHDNKGNQKSRFRVEINQRPDKYNQNFVICFYVHIANYLGYGNDRDIILSI